MEINPQRVRSAEFKTVRKGVDPDELRVFLGDGRVCPARLT